MASIDKTPKPVPAFIKRLRKELRERLQAVDVEAQVRAERVGDTKLYRVTVISSDFAALRHVERQNLVWQIADAAIPDNKLQVTMIQTFTPSEAGIHAA